MIRNHPVSKQAVLRLSTLGLAVAALTSLGACSAFSGLVSGDKVDYRTGARQTVGLDVPPDLTQLSRDARGQMIQGGTITASALQQQQTSTAAAVPAADKVALDRIGELRVERNGNDRWLFSPQTPEQVWPTVRGFWLDQGFEISVEQPELGVMETSWNENRAKLPQDFLRKSLGWLIDGMYSTGERDKYRVSLERGAKGGTEIRVVHRGMQEVYTGSSESKSTGWQARPNDPSLESEMISRLLLRLGGRQEQAKAAALTVASAASAAPTAADALLPGASRRPLSEVPNQLQVNEGFERAWRRVGQSLDRHGFTIEDRDRSQGLFFLRYADPNMVGKEEANFFAKLFGAKDSTASRYRVSVKSEGEKSTVMVLDDKGQQQTNENAKRILGLLMDDLR
ncbi:outer membrane protein assembly factor BamC [Pelomonas sp. SE-A7]|uniref:outer membrane protein assembly factor BamC n=1 Tax=Pelomonas sp. SE-A7 TaxID=3054953 RepID=UPI00259CAB7E|nr:outer membrane protein assembly factor BamC [Pelomonas sp. SE-A7]MDM4765506.1 outer membrane protein assembly factor BamC [Pelomonas sp. SE-A7]